LPNIHYAARVLSGVRFKKLKTVVDRVHKITGKSKAFLLCDIAACALFYGAGYNDYNIFAFYDMNRAQRKTYVTRMRNKSIISYFNDEAYSYIFDKKNVFNARFKDFIRRGFLDLAEADFDAFCAFLDGKDVVFAKPNSSESGKGIEKLKKSDFPSLSAMYEYIKSPDKRFGVLEELIVQHPDMEKLYPLSVNTIRIATAVDEEGNPHCAYATCKMGNEGKFVDNMENSGLACPIDPETGLITGVAHTSRLVNFDTHPYTGVKLVGYKIPFAKEAVELCKKAALVVPQVRYVGWDVCIMPDGPAIVEGNNYPGYDFTQLPEHTPDKIGAYPFFVKMSGGKLK
jgi:hypothetical protein